MSRHWDPLTCRLHARNCMPETGLKVVKSYHGWVISSELDPGCVLKEAFPFPVAAQDAVAVIGARLCSCCTARSVVKVTSQDNQVSTK